MAPTKTPDANDDAAVLAEAERAEQERLASEAADDERDRINAEERNAEERSATGPDAIEGPTGTVIPPQDGGPTLRVEVKTNSVLGNQAYTVGQKVAVPDDEVTRGGIALEMLRLLDDDEALDGEDANTYA